MTATFEFTSALLAVIARLAKPLAQVNQCARLADSAFCGYQPHCSVALCCWRCKGVLLHRCFWHFTFASLIFLDIVRCSALLSRQVWLHLVCLALIHLPHRKKSSEGKGGVDVSRSKRPSRRKLRKESTSPRCSIPTTKSSRWC